jgi:beta-N-acetylhexosaminidase
MQMHAISKNYGFEKAIELAVNAGVDILMFGNNVDPKDTPITASEVHAILKKLVKKKKITEERINTAFSRIMALKNKKVN